MNPRPSFLISLQAEADRAAAAEAEYRAQAAQRTTALARDRSFAFRRLNLLRAVAAAVAGVKDETAAAAQAAEAVREALGWSVDGDARREVLDRFAPVAHAVLAESGGDELLSAAMPAVATELAAFERWYAATHESPFWALFDQYVTETPVVDF
jgi:hypothetical protein